VGANHVHTGTHKLAGIKFFDKRTTMKTLEFKAHPTQTQTATLESWLATQKWVWNRSVGLIKDFARFNPYHKPSKCNYPASPIVVENRRRWQPRTLWADEAGIGSPLLTREIIAKGNKEIETYRAGGVEVKPWLSGEYPSCPIGWQVADGQAIEPTGKNGNLIHPVRIADGGSPVVSLSAIGMVYAFAQKLNPRLKDCPANFNRGTVAAAAESWKAFKTDKTGTRRPPKFKRKYDRVDTLIHNDSKGLRTEGNRVWVPSLGWLRVQGLLKRWPQDVPFCPLKICRKASGWYVQLTGEVGDRRPVKFTGKVAGLDAGARQVYTDDVGRSLEPPRYLKANAQKLARLQRKYARSFQANGVMVAGRKRWGADGPTKNAQKIQRRIGRLHEKIARSRRAFNHWQSTKLMRQFDAIAVEDLNLRGMTRAPKAKASDDGKGFAQNGAKRKAGLNKVLLDNAIGQLYQLMEAKMTAAGKAFMRVPPHYTSRRCPNCGSEKPENRPRPGVAFRCVDCGHYDPNSDRNAAINIKAMMTGEHPKPEPKPKPKATKARKGKASPNTEPEPVKTVPIEVAGGVDHQDSKAAVRFCDQLSLF
jgi:putative transposase